MLFCCFLVLFQLSYRLDFKFVHDSATLGKPVRKQDMVREFSDETLPIRGFAGPVQVPVNPLSRKLTRYPDL